MLNLVHELGLKPIRVSSTSGGEYASACPGCGGKDRFRIWPLEKGGRYWCRQCLVKGDAIQFCRDYLGLSFTDAEKKVGRQSGQRDFHQKDVRNFSPKKVQIRPGEWCNAAKDFVEYCHKILIKEPDLLEILLKERGLRPSTIVANKLGWNPQDIFEDFSVWGGVGSIFLPRGYVLPKFYNGSIVGVKIRRDIGKESVFPKYHILKGSAVAPSVFGDFTRPVILVEAEFDAMLLQQEAGDLCTCISLGGASNRPDSDLHDLLLAAPCILLSLDLDDAGKAQSHFWKSGYSNLRCWPISKCKSPGDAFLQGFNLREWVLQGLKQYQLQGGT